MDEQDAIEYLRTQCRFNDNSDDALRKHWQAARAKLGVPTPKAGKPGILDIPQKHSSYLDGVRRNPRYGITVGNMVPAFKQVELAPIIAFQFHVHTEKQRTPLATASGAAMDASTPVAVVRSNGPSPFRQRQPASTSTPVGTRSARQTIESSSAVRVTETNGPPSAHAGTAASAGRRQIAKR
jgi:hypothetical protein